MSGNEAQGTTEPSFVQRFVDFPLVALIVATLLFIFVIGIGDLVGRQFNGLADPLRTCIQVVVAILLYLAIYKFLLVRLGEQPRDDLQLRGSSRDLTFGLVIGFALIAASVGVATLLGVYRITGPGDTSRLVTELFQTALLPGVREELLFRGILFRWIEAFGGSWAALAVTSFLFGLIHIFNPDATWFSSFCIAVEAGVLLGGAYMLTRSLWLPIGLHAAWNFTEGEVFDVPVSGFDEHGLVQGHFSGPVILSGGPFGLEASLITLVLATVVGLLFVALAVRRGKIAPPIWRLPRDVQRKL
jgi:CAAX protease family protein